MPGLVALLMPKYDRFIEENITEMTIAMCYEDFYKKDVFINGTSPFVASRVHLNIINEETQPIYNEEGNILIMMDGELHNRNEIREKVSSAGHILRTTSDAELLLHWYEEVGDTFANDLNGWFLALIHHKIQKKTLIINDCFGIYRAFYVHHNATFIVSSEIKSLLKYDKLSYNPNEGKFSEYFLYDAILNDETFFREIRRLPPASIWTYKDGSISKKQYLDHSRLQGENTPLGKTEFVQEATELYKKIIPRYVSGKSIGLSLTGGWDTRSILALVNDLGYSMPCYTWCGPYQDSLDVKVAREIARISDQEYHVFRISEDFFESFPDYAYKTIYISDGSADIFKSHEIYLNKLTRALAPIRLTGKYGSQIMAGGFLHPKLTFRKEMFSEQFLRDMGAIEQFIHPFGDWKSTLDAIRWLWPSGYAAIETSQVVLRSPFLDKDLALFLFSAPKSFLHGSAIQQYCICKYCSRLAGIPSNKGACIYSEDMFKNIGISFNALLYKILTKLDKAYLHHNVPHIFSRVDPFMKFARLEKPILGHCNLPAFRRWIKDELQDFFKEILLDERTLSRPYLNPQFVKKMASAHFGNRANYTKEIGKIISLEIWHRLFVD